MTALLVHELDQIARKHSDDIAFLDHVGRALSYQNLMRQIGYAQGWLNSMGLNPGDSVVVMLPNAIETLVLFLACVRGGFIYAPLPCTATLREVIRWKKITRAEICLIAEPVAISQQAQIKTLDWSVEIIKMGGELEWPACKHLPIYENSGLVLATSGSTGEPKAMLLSCDRLWLSANAFLSFHTLQETQLRFWNYLPMSYLGGLFNLALIPLAAGGSAYIDDAFSGKTFLGFWQTVGRYDINSLWLVPSILRGLLTLSHRSGQDRFYSRIKHCFLGTAPIFLEEKNRFSSVFGIMPYENYGLSETTFISSESKNNLSARLEGGVGEIMPQIKIKCKTPGKEGERAVSEIYVKTPFSFMGYLSENGLTPPAMDEDGYIATGDFGHLVDNQLVLTGRGRDIIKKGGVLILLREIEQLSVSYFNVVEAAAVSIEHPFYGESYNLYIRLQDPIENKNEFLNLFSAWVHTQIFKEKWPEKILICNEFPRTASGKIQKHILSARSQEYA